MRVGISMLLRAWGVCLLMWIAQAQDVDANLQLDIDSSEERTVKIIEDVDQTCGKETLQQAC